MKRRVVPSGKAPEKNKIEKKKKLEKTLKRTRFKIGPEKKKKLEFLMDTKSKKVTKALRTWMEKDPDYRRGIDKSKFLSKKK